MYFNDFANKQDIIGNFGGNSAKDLENAEIIFASYTNENYSGNAFCCA